MANTITLLSYANTFGDWVVTTNALARENNDLAANTYTKNSGKFFITSSGIGLHVANNALFQGSLEVSGVGSLAIIQNNATVQGQLYATNTTLGLVVTSTANTANLNVLGSNVALYVANNSSMGGTLDVRGNTNLANSLIVFGPTTLSNTIYITGSSTVANTLSVTDYVYANNVTSNNDIKTQTISISSYAYTSNITSNNNIQTSGLSVTNTANVGSLTSNTDIRTNTFNANTITNTGNVYTNNLVANTNAQISTLSVTNAANVGSLTSNTDIRTNTFNSNTITNTGNGYTNNLTANTNVQTGTLSASTYAYVNNLTSNNNVQASTISASAYAYVNNLTANTNVQTGTLSASTYAYVNNLTANTNAQVPKISVTNTANVGYLTANTGIITDWFYANTATNTGKLIVGSIASNGDIGGATANIVGRIHTNTLVANSTINSSGPAYLDRVYTNNASQLSSTLINGDLNVSGNFILTGTTVYDSNTIVLKSGSALPDGVGYATFGVNRGGTPINGKANGEIQWDNITTTWKLRDVAGTNNTIFYNIVTEKYTANLTNSGLVQLSNSNTSLSITQALSLAGANSLSQYIAATSAGANNYTNANISANVATINGSISSNVATLNSNITANSNADRLFVNSNISANVPQPIATTSNVQFLSIGVGTAASGNTGEIRATNTITAFYSDDNLKDRLRNIENPVSKVLALNGFYFYPNEEAQSLGYANTRHIGVSAQEVQRILPEIVVPAPISDKYLTVHYDRLIPLLIESIKELKCEIDQLKKTK
jgi:hypothetical protein